MRISQFSSLQIADVIGGFVDPYLSRNSFIGAVLVHIKKMSQR